MRVIGRRQSQITVTVGTDQIMTSYPLPAGGRLNGVHLRCHVLGPEGATFQQVVMYGMAGFVVPVPDPDGATLLNALWDQLIPKDIDEASGVLDLDTGSTDVTPEFEMGEPDWSGVFNLTSLNPQQIFKRRRLLSTVNGMVNYEVVDAGADLWVPGEYFATQLKRNVTVGMPSMVLFGFSAPSLDDTNQTPLIIPTEIQWTLLQYLEITLENAFMSLIGLVETGAETPFVDSATFIASLIEDDVFEGTAGAFLAVAWTCFTQATFDISVPGRIQQKTLTSDAG